MAEPSGGGGPARRRGSAGRLSKTLGGEGRVEKRIRSGEGTARVAGTWSSSIGNRTLREDTLGRRDKLPGCPCRERGDRERDPAEALRATLPLGPEGAEPFEGEQ